MAGTSVGKVGENAVPNFFRGPHQTEVWDKSRANSAKAFVMAFHSEVDFYPNVESPLESLL